MRTHRLTAIILFLSGLGTIQGDEIQEPFPVSEMMTVQVRFWVDVFTKYSIHQKIIYDSKNPHRIYKVVDFRDPAYHGKSSEQNRPLVLKSERAKVVSLLRRLASGSVSLKNMDAEETRIYRLFGEKPKKKDFLLALRSVHMQGGMKEAFLNGLRRSGRYLYAMKRIFRDNGLPEQLVYLPHIESSFHPHAHSRSGAVGIWQITRDTGKSYLTINRYIDERRDPFLSSQAAARLLKHYYARLKSWPLAITAYNHGLGGITRAVRRLGTKDIDTIISHYKSSRFGFASKNFYAEFLAAVHVAENPDKYFDVFTYAEPYHFISYELPQQASLKSITETLGVSEEEIRRLNPALRSPILKGVKELPKEYSLRLPAMKSTSSQFASNRTGNEQNYQSDHSWLSNLIEWVGLVWGSRRNSHRVSPFSDPLHARQGDTGGQMASMDLQADSVHGEITCDKDASLTAPDKLREQDAQILALQSDELESYKVNGNTLIVQPEETLGHYADWLEISTNRLRRHNGMRYGQRIHVGQNLRLPFGTISKDEFEERRVTHHRSIRKSFYDTHRIDGSEIHEVRRGESLWTVAKYRFKIPLWLVLAYNSIQDLNNLKPGEKVYIPIVTKIQMRTTL